MQTGRNKYYRKEPSQRSQRNQPFKPINPNQRSQRIANRLRKNVLRCGPRPNCSLLIPPLFGRITWGRVRMPY